MACDLDRKTAFLPKGLSVRKRRTGLSLLPPAGEFFCTLFSDLKIGTIFFLVRKNNIFHGVKREPYVIMTPIETISAVKSCMR